MKNLRKFLIAFLLMFFTVNSIFLTQKMSVSAAENSFKMINQSQINMVKGEYMLLGTTWTGIGNVKWKVSNPKILKISPRSKKDAYCRVTAKKTGKVKVTAIAPNKKKVTCTIEIFNERFVSNTIIPIQKGKSRIVNFKNGDGKERVTSENTKIVKIKKLSKARYKLIGVKAGTTKMVVKSGKKILVYTIRVQ